MTAFVGLCCGWYGAYDGREGRICRRRSVLRCVREGVATEGRDQQTKMEDVFAQDAGKDLFFSGMEQEEAIEIIVKPSRAMEDHSDRYIAAERLKFFPSDASTEALIRCIGDDDSNELEDRIAKRKAIESLGRFRGEYMKDQVIEAVLTKLEDDDQYTVEVAVWTLSEVGFDDEKIGARIVSLLDRDDVNKRVIMQAISSCEISEGIGRIRDFLEDEDLATRCAAIGALSRLTGDKEVLKGVTDVLKSPELNVRRAAMEDITLAKHFPALDSVLVAPNSMVLKTRTTRSLLDSAIPTNEVSWDSELEQKLDQLIWDHPAGLDFLGVTADTAKARSLTRCVERLYKNDALFSYLGAKVLIEDHSWNEEAGKAVFDSYEALNYFDYFAAYHVFKALGWLKYKPAGDMLLDHFNSLPPRFFNHQAGAALGLALIGDQRALDDISRVGKETTIWELKYACLIAAEKLGDGGALRSSLVDDSDWLIRTRSRSDRSFDHLQ